jgi:lysophospholipase L1-like esterase/RimJ/RimL family protein N-acetyltransferase
MEIITKRLKLIPINEDHVQDIFKEFNSQVTKYMYPKPADTVQETIKFVTDSMAKFKYGTDIVFVATLKETNEFIGCMGIHDINTKTPALGVWTKISSHGHGYGLEGMNGIIKYAKKHLDVDYLIYPVDRRNHASRRIPEQNKGLIAKCYLEKSAMGIQLYIIEYHIPIKSLSIPRFEKPLVVFQGDSITDCGRFYEPLQLGNGYVKLMSEYLPDATVLNHGISGHRTRELLERWERETLSLKPDMISILIGINDIWHLYKYGKLMEENEYLNNLTAILKRTKEVLPDVKIMLIDPFVFPIGEYEPTWQNDLDAEIEIVHDLAKTYADYHVPMQTILNEIAQSFSMDKVLGDGVHPTDFGHQLIAEVLLPQVCDFIREFKTKQI